MLSGSEPLQLNRILQLCCVVCVPLLVAWLAFWRASKTGRRMENFKICLLCCSWIACSVGMHTLNKTLVSLLEAPSCITLVQMVIAAVVMFIFNVSKLRNCISNHPDQVRRWLIVPCIFSGMLLSSFFTYSYVTLCVMTVVRNLAPLIAMPIEHMVMPPEKRPEVTLESLIAMMIMLGGAIVYAASAPEISTLGIVFAVANMLLAICDRMVQRRLLSQDCKNMDLEVCTFINNFLGTVPTIFCTYITHEVAEAVEGHKDEWLAFDTVILLVLSGLIGLGICYFGLAVQRVISATSFLVLQNCSKLLVVGVGIGIFGDPITSQLIVAGLLLSLGGSGWYGKAQIYNVYTPGKGAAAYAREEDKDEHLPLMNEEKKAEGRSEP